MIKSLAFLLCNLLCLVAYDLSAQVFGNGVLFNGNTDYIEVPDNPALRPSSITVETWAKVGAFTSVKTLPNTGFQYIVFKQTPTETYFEGYSLSLNDVTKSFFGVVASSTGVQVVTIAPNIELGKWYHVAMTANSSETKLYLNGALVDSKPTGFPLYLGTKPLYIGRSGEPKFEGYFNGAADDVRIWNFVKSDAEILSSYKSELAGTENGLIAYYNMNINGAGAGLTVPNNSPSGTPLNGLSFGTTTTPIFSGNTILPVDIISFTASRKQTGIELNWVTAKEVNAHHYQVERSGNDYNFTPLFQQPAGSGSSPTKAYTFTDTHPYVGSNFYRLKIVDKDTKYAYSKTIEAQVTAATIKIFPNPIDDQLHLQLPEPKKVIEVQLATQDGRILFSSLTRNKKDVVIDTRFMKPGVYVLSAMIDGQRITSKIVKK